jgi:hypothetical protein
MVGRRATSAAFLWGACALVFAATISITKAGAACSCGGEWGPTDADTVFQGEAVEVHRPLHLRFRPEGGKTLARLVWGLWSRIARPFDSDVKTVFRVSRSWKGDPPEFVTINTGSGTCCECSVGTIFAEGGNYVVFAVKYGGELHVNSCAGMMVSGKALPAAEAAKLGVGTRPSKGSRSLPMTWRYLLFPGVLALPIVLAGVTSRTFVERLRRRRRRA